MGLSSSKQVAGKLRGSPEFNSACDMVYEQCLSLVQHAFPGVRPYQLASASDRLHQTLTELRFPLVENWVPAPPTRSQIDKALKKVLAIDDSEGDITLGAAEFKEFAVDLFVDAVVSNAEKALIRRVPVGIAAIAGIGAVTRLGKGVVGTVIGVYAVGAATSIYLSLTC